jgi:hypothetical protein
LTCLQTKHQYKNNTANHEKSHVFSFQSTGFCWV